MTATWEQIRDNPRPTDTLTFQRNGAAVQIEVVDVGPDGSLLVDWREHDVAERRIVPAEQWRGFFNIYEREKMQLTQFQARTLWEGRQPRKYLEAP